MGFPNAAQLARLRAQYPAGQRVELLSPLDDPYARLQAGDRGTVQFVDDAGTVHVRWDCGSGLGLIPGEDHFKNV